MGNTVQGKNILAKMKVDATYYNVFCGKSLTFTLDQDELETTTVNSGTMREYIAGIGNAVLEISGVTVLDNTGSRIAITYLQAQSIRQQVQDWQILMTDDDGDQISYTFQGIIRSTSFNKSIPGYSQSNVSIRVSGEITIDPVAPPPSGDFEVFADYWTTTNGQNYISGASTGNTDGTNYTLADDDEILAVWVEDMPMYEVTGTPTAGQPEYKYNTSTDRLETGVTFDGAQKVYVQFKRPI